MIKTKAKVTEGGRMVIPIKIRQELGIEIGQEVILTLKKGVFEVSTPNEALIRLQNKVKKSTAGKRSLVDELIAERRKEAENE